MARLIDILNGTWGRLARVVLGLALIAVGLTTLGAIGVVLAVVGLGLLGLGLSGRCVLEPFARAQPRHPRGRWP
jgi:hypothetical protein